MPRALHWFLWQTHRLDTYPRCDSILVSFTSIHALCYRCTAATFLNVSWIESSIGANQWRIQGGSEERQSHGFSTNKRLLAGSQFTTNISTRNIIWWLESTENLKSVFGTCRGSLRRSCGPLKPSSLGSPLPSNAMFFLPCCMDCKQRGLNSRL